MPLGGMMKIGKTMEKALNGQLNSELYSYYLYLAMAAHFEQKNLKGIASWLEKQAGEEQMHAMKIYKYIVDRDGEVSLAAIAAPPATWKAALDAFVAAYAHEQKVSRLFDALVVEARKSQDYTTEVFLHWFVSEQVEEEASTKEIVDKLRLAKDSSAALFMLDAELGKRQN